MDKNSLKNKDRSCTAKPQIDIISKPLEKNVTKHEITKTITIII